MFHIRVKYNRERRVPIIIIETIKIEEYGFEESACAGIIKRYNFPKNPIEGGIPIKETIQIRKDNESIGALL